MKTSFLGKFLFVVTTIIWTNNLFAQGYNLTSKNTALSEELFTVQFNDLSLLFKNLEAYLRDDTGLEAYEECFLKENEARKYTEYIHQNTDYAIDEKYISAVASFYYQRSSEAKTFLLQYRYVLQNIELYKYLQRYGTTSKMQVVIPLLNMHLKGGAIEALKLNLILTDHGYKILNIEN